MISSPFPQGLRVPHCSPMTPGDLMTLAQVSRADPQPPGVSQAGLWGEAHRLPLSFPHPGPRCSYRPHGCMTWAMYGSGTRSAGAVPKRGSVPRAPSAHSIKTSPGLVSRPLLLQVMVRGPTPGGLLFHQEINKCSHRQEGPSLWAPCKISVNGQTARLCYFPPPQTWTWRGRGFPEEAAFTQSPKLPWDW